MKKNVASQVIGAQMVAAADGSAFTGAVAVSVTGDGGTQATGSVGAGACMHEGNGFHSYAPAQAETNFDHVAFTFVGTGAVPATVQVYTQFPQTGDAFARLGAPAGATVAADVAALKTETASIQADTNDIQARLPAALAGGRMDSSTGAMAADVLTATAINADAFTAAKFASDVTTELQSGLATATALATAQADLDDIQSRLPAALISGRLDATVGAMQANVLTAAAAASDLTTELQSGLATSSALSSVASDVTAVKAKTDNLPGDPADQSLLIAAADAIMGRLGAPAGASVSADVAAVKADTASTLAAVDTEVGAIKTVTDHLATALELDGGVYRFTTNALEQAPTGGSAPTAVEIADEVETRTIAAVTTVNGLAANVVTAAALATDAVTEIQSGLATASALSTVAGYVDTEVAAIKAKTDLLPASPAATGDIPSAGTIADAVWDEAVDGTTTARQSVRLANSALGGKASGLETTTAVFRDLADTKDRISATVDADGNRTAVSRDLS